MPIKVGDQLPSAKFRVMTGEGPAWKTTDEIFKGKKVALFAVPGAFTGTCHKMHVPSIVQNLAALKAKGVDTVAMTAVNDMFVMDAWKKATAADKRRIPRRRQRRVRQGDRSYVRRLRRGLGTRSKRYSMLVEDGAVKVAQCRGSARQGRGLRRRRAAEGSSEFASSHAGAERMRRSP